MSSGGTIVLRGPTVDDGRAIHDLVRRSALDENSPYAYLLAATHFSDTSVVAEDETGRVVGFVVAYRPPETPEALFVWQVGVDESARRRGLGRRLLDAATERPGARDARFLTATVTPANDASMRLFRSFAEAREAPFERFPSHFTREHFGDAGHEPEDLVRIGPWENRG